MHSVSQKPLIATFQLLSAASLNSVQSQNGLLGNGLYRNSNPCGTVPRLFRHGRPLP